MTAVTRLDSRISHADARRLAARAGEPLREGMHVTTDAGERGWLVKRAGPELGFPRATWQAWVVTQNVSRSDWVSDY